MRYVVRTVSEFMPRITSRRGSQRAAGSLVWWTIIASSLAVLLAGCAATLPEGEYYCGKSDLQVQDERLPARDETGTDPVGPAPGNISVHRCLYPESTELYRYIVTWDEVDGAAFYEIQWSFSNLEYKARVRSTTFTSSWSIHRKIHLQVRAGYADGSVGPWESV